jgi:hypothetical protein
MGKQTMRQAARLAASQVQASCGERAERDRRLEELAVAVPTALGERDATIATTEQRAGAALQAMITDESLTVSEAVQWCALSHREAARVRRLTARTPTFDDPAHGCLQARMGFWTSCLHKRLYLRERQPRSVG